MQQLVILSVINCSSTCFGRLYAHHQVRLRFTAYDFLSCCSCCDVGESGGKLCALCGGGCKQSLVVASSWSRLYLLIKMCLMKRTSIAESG
jgi:hypothetical protein